MRPVDQTRINFGDSETEAPGNCWAASLASILEVPLSELPDEADFWKPGMKPEESWIPYSKATHEWLLRCGFVLVEVRCPNVHYCGPLECWQATHCILSGPSPRNEKAQHAVVGRGNQIAHDPHPSRAGLAGDWKTWWYEFLVRA